MDIINCECIANVITCLFKASHVMGLPISNLVVVFSLWYCWFLCSWAYCRYNGYWSCQKFRDWPKSRVLVMKRNTICKVWLMSLVWLMLWKWKALRMWPTMMWKQLSTSWKINASPIQRLIRFCLQYPLVLGNIKTNFYYYNAYTTDFCAFFFFFNYLFCPSVILGFAMQVLEFFHFSCTSEDINNLAHGLMLKEALNNVLFPVMDEVIGALCDMAKEYAHIPMLSRTHGQVTLRWYTLELYSVTSFSFRASEQPCSMIFAKGNGNWKTVANRPLSSGPIDLLSFGFSYLLT